MFNLIVTALKVLLLFGLYAFLIVVLRAIYTDLKRERAAEPHLIAMKGAPRGARYPIGGELVIGRDPLSDLVISDEYASSRHAKVFSEGGRFFVVDLGSTNGTFLNGRKMQRSALSAGDRIKIGESVFQYME